ncbi:hypothetical protein AB0F11_03155 [Streptomyces sp. NPDC032472]|uniref:hypothetical protein n=1 Tax=Streptomyces sp. NPDC032472 TaxID=3155018 RepID=UPI0033F5F522
MSGDNFYFGDNVNMTGGANNTGMVKNVGAPAAAPAADPALLEAIGELRSRIEELRGQLPPASAQVLDAALPAATGDAEVPAESRQSALMSIAGIAAVVGPLGQSVVDAVARVIELLGS